VPRLAVVGARVDAPRDHALQLHGRLDLFTFGNPPDLLTVHGDLLSQIASRVTGTDKRTIARGDCRGSHPN
jgi:hypothetical protein